MSVQDADGTSSSGTTVSNPKPFDLATVHKMLEQALLDDQQVDLKSYCDAWHELNKFLDTLGTLFHFVTHDVKQKCEIVQEFVRKDTEHYQTLQKAIKHEVDNKLTNTKKPSCSRTVLRLHRALNYLLDFFEKLVEAKLEAKCSSLSVDAYHRTLGKYHPWLVRKAASLAMYSLPLKSVLLNRIDSGPNNVEKVTQLITDIISAGRPVFDITEQLYTDENLHDLP